MYSDRMVDRQNPGADESAQMVGLFRKRWNFDGYICLQYSLLWAVLGMASILCGNALFLDLFRIIPVLIRTILLWCFLVVLLLDFTASVAAVFHIQKEVPSTARYTRSRVISLSRAVRFILRHVEHRMAKAYPVLLEKAEKTTKVSAVLPRAAAFTNYFCSLSSVLSSEISSKPFSAGFPWAPG